MKQYIFKYNDGSQRIWTGDLPDPLPEEWKGYTSVEQVEIPDPAQDPAWIWSQKLAGRIKDPVTGIEFLAREKTRDLLSATMVLLTNAKDRGMVQGSTPYSLWDADGKEFAMTVDQAIDVLLRYGLQWSQMYVEFAP